MTLANFLKSLYNNTKNENIEWDVTEESDGLLTKNKYYISTSTDYSGNNYEIRLETGSNILEIEENFTNTRSIKLTSEELINLKERIICLVTEEIFESDEEVFDNIISSFTCYLEEIDDEID